jgi:hypothetical protein
MSVWQCPRGELKLRERIHSRGAFAVDIFASFEMPVANEFVPKGDGVPKIANAVTPDC